MGYDAFISYSHAPDGELAAALQTGLERLSKPWWRRTPFLRVFRDETSLAAGHDLGDRIEQALETSDNLVVMLSPEAADSPWVSKELEYWLQTKGVEKMIFVVTDWPAGTAGTDEASAANLAAFAWNGDDVPVALQGLLDEPLAVDMRWARGSSELTLANEQFQDDVAEIAAAIKNENKDALVGALVAMRTRAKILTGTLIMAGLVLLGAIGIAGLGWVAANSQRADAEADALVAQEAAAMAEQDRMTAEQLRDAAEAAAADAETKRAAAEASAAAAASAQEDAEAAEARAIEAERLAREAEQLALADLEDANKAKADAEAAAAVAEQARAEAAAAQATAEKAAAEAKRLQDEAEAAAAAAEELRQEAETAAAEALVVAISRQLAGQALARVTTELDLASLLAVEAVGVSPTVEARGALISALQSAPGLTKTLHATQTPQTMALSPSGRGAVVTGFSDLMYWPEGASEPTVTEDVFSADLGGSEGSAFLSETIVALSAEGGVSIYDLADGSSFTSLRDASGGMTVSGLLADPGGAKIAAWVHTDFFENSDEVTVWTVTESCVRNGDQCDVLSIPVGSEAENNLAVLSSDGNMVATRWMSDQVRIWDTATGAALTTIANVSPNPDAAAFSPKGDILGVASADTLRFWDVATGIAVGDPMSIESGEIVSVAFSPDGQLVATGTDGAQIHLWSVGSQIELGTARSMPDGSVHSIVFTPDSTALWASSWSPEIRLIEAEAKPAASIRSEVAGSGAVATSPDGKLVVVRTEIQPDVEYGFEVRDAETATVQNVVRGAHIAPISDFAFSPDGSLLATAGRDTVVRLWDTRTWKAVGQPMEGHVPTVEAVTGLTYAQFDPTGERLVTGGAQGEVKVWEVATQDLLSEFSTEETKGPKGRNSDVTGLALSSDGSLLAIGGIGAVEIRSSTTLELVGEPVETITPAGAPSRLSVTGVAFSPDGKRFAASTSSAAAVFVWDAVKRDLIAILPIDRAIGWAVTYSPDGAYLAVAKFDGTVLLFDGETGTPLGLPIAAHDGPVLDVTFSPDGLRLYSADDATLNAMDFNSETWAELVCDRTGRSMTVHEWAVYRPAVPYMATCD